MPVTMLSNTPSKMWIPFSVSILLISNSGCKTVVKPDSPDAGESSDSDTGVQDSEDSPDGDGGTGGGCVDIEDGGKDTQTETTIDTNTHVDSDSDGEADAGDGGSADAGDTSTAEKCPEEMSYVSVDISTGVTHPFCIDKWEASRDDATSTNPGSDNEVARSRPGVLPWFQNPMTWNAFLLFQTACNAAGKRICEREEWFDSCRGSQTANYVYGNSFNSETCNSVDTYCDDYCDDHQISEASCYTETNCGYHCGDNYSENITCFHLSPTGSFSECTNEYETFDMNGNLWEVVPSPSDSRGYEVRGGAFNCAAPSTRLRCDYNAGWSALYAGFRCCADPMEN